ncbi:Isochorismatase family [Geosmithia morbida]|uniref:Isochorismatase family n=1 Tax=Geosmithia morbida TaxID=1094350 RepID=A0A9P5D204_9HYPO|nr:Isochorismatase family [Geosmithia morbida]KAF4121006.1 Isochorismatase family [Geosmithia morbida]
MFPFDHTALPQLTPRRAFLAVDFQNEFTAEDGALPVTEPLGYVQRTKALATAFREKGDVIWVKSRFEGSRAADGEQIIVSDELLPPLSARRSAARPLKSSRAQAAISVETPVEAGRPPDPEAFLSHDDPVCLKPESTTACDWTAEIKDSMQKGDMTFTKTHYSAFQGTHLLHALRAKMAMEVFICGSLANAGVYATAMDAAGHGLSITVVEDCCGYRIEERQRKAIKSLMDFTGCEIASSEEVLETIMPPQTKLKRSEPSPREVPAESPNTRESKSPGIVKPMTGLRLESGTPAPAIVDEMQTKAVGETEPQKKPEKNTEIVKAQEKHILAEKLKQGEVSRQESEEKITPLKETPSKLSAASESTTDSGDDKKLRQTGLCEGDTDIIENLLPEDLEKGIFGKLNDEVSWKRMSHQGGEVPRLVAVQGQVAEDGTIPVYRHPSDESPPLLPFSPTVLKIKAATEKHLGHTLNHVLIQFYRDGKDYISEHSDKTLDIVKGSYIANVSLGAERTMVLRTKRRAKDLPVPEGTATEGPRRQTQHAKLPHNSLCRMGLRTNMKWLHAIRQDKRAEKEKTATELAFSGSRISLTFRNIGTFLDREEKMIFGQGAVGKKREDAQAVINGTGPEAIELLKAFSAENHSSEFDWDERYGKGFNVLHMSTSPRFFASPDAVINMRIALMLSELGINYAKGSMGPTVSNNSEQVVAEALPILPIKFVDNDAAKSTVHGDMAIMMYLDRVHGCPYGNEKPEDGANISAKIFSRFQQALQLHGHAQPLLKTSGGKDIDLEPFRRELEKWNEYAGEDGAEFIAGPKPTLPDFVVWPVLHALCDKNKDELFEGMDHLKKYYEFYGSREATKKAVERASA